MNLCVIDTETTSLEPETGAVIEFAAAAYSVECRDVLWSFSAVLSSVKTNPIPEINFITDEMLASAPHWAISKIASMICKYEPIAFAAHHAAFDHSFCQSTLPSGVWEAFPWICTQEDIEYPHQRNSRHLNHLAADHGLLFGAQKHRALADVLLVCDLLGTVKDLAGQIGEALKPKILIQALVSFEKKQLAKDANFHWNPDVKPKRWEKRVPFDTDLEQWPFNVVEIN